MLKDKIAAGKIRICQNPACRKVFSEQIIVENLRAPIKEPYQACPFCLTEIVASENVVPEANGEQVLKEDSVEKPENCQYYLGFLSEKPHEEAFPEECLTCKVIVRCMFESRNNSS